VSGNPESNGNHDDNIKFLHMKQSELQPQSTSIPHHAASRQQSYQLVSLLVSIRLPQRVTSGLVAMWWRVYGRNSSILAAFINLLLIQHLGRCSKLVHSLRVDAVYPALVQIDAEYDVCNAHQQNTQSKAAITSSKCVMSFTFEHSMIMNYEKYSCRIDAKLWLFHDLCLSIIMLHLQHYSKIFQLTS